MSTSVRCSISLRILRRVSIDLGELGQTFGVEGVRRIEIFEAGLVEVDDGDVLELQAIGGERLGGELADLVGVVAALLVHFLERHLGRHRAHRRGELAFEQLADAVRLQRAAAERLRGGGDRRARRADAHEELGDEVDAHAVLGDQRAVVAAHHLDAHARSC